MLGNKFNFKKCMILYIIQYRKLEYNNNLQYKQY